MLWVLLRDYQDRRSRSALAANTRNVEKDHHEQEPIQ
jgi:hypothetical protein